MVLHQRTRQAFQSKDLSAAYSRAWSDLAEPFRPVSQEEPLIQAWLDFVEASRHEQETYGKTTAQQQAAAFKKLGTLSRSASMFNPEYWISMQHIIRWTHDVCTRF